MGYKITFAAENEETNQKLICSVVNPDDPSFEEIKGTVEQSEKSGVILESRNNVQPEVVYIKPEDGATINQDDVFFVTVTATAAEKFRKALSATFRIEINPYSISVEIEDSVGATYLTAKLKNYNSTEQDVWIIFDPKILRLDLTDKWYQQTNQKIIDGNATEAYRETQTIDGISYIKKLRFTMPRESLITMRFYKVSVGTVGVMHYPDYTYPVLDASGNVVSGGDCKIKLIVASD